MHLWAVGGISTAVSPGKVAPLTEVSLSPPSWSVGNWSTCSRTCGGGTQSRPVQCTRRAHYVSERVAASLCPQPVPSSRQACHSQSCPPAWSTGPWAEVSGAGLCGGAASGPPPPQRLQSWILTEPCRACCWTPRARSDGLLAGCCPLSSRTVLSNLRKGMEEEVRGL